MLIIGKYAIACSL